MNRYMRLCRHNRRDEHVHTNVSLLCYIFKNPRNTHLISQLVSLRLSPEAVRQADGQDAVVVKVRFGPSLERFGNSRSAVDVQRDSSAFDAKREVVPFGVGEIALKPRRTFAGQVVLIGKVKAGIVGDFDADFRFAFTIAERKDESRGAVTRRFTRNEQGKVRRERFWEDLPSRDVNRVRAGEEKRRRTSWGSLDAARKPVGTTKMMNEIRGA